MATIKRGTEKATVEDYQSALHEFGAEVKNCLTVTA